MSVPSPSGASPWRTLLAGVFIIVGALLTPVALVATTAHTVATDTEIFVGATGPLITDQEFQAWLSAQAVNTVEQQVGVERIVDSALRAVGLDPEGAVAGTVREATLRQTRRVLSGTAEHVVESEGFARLWNAGLRSAHRQFAGFGAADPDALFQLGPSGLELRLEPVLAEIRTALEPETAWLARLIPDTERTVPVLDSPHLTRIQDGYRWLELAARWVPIVALSLLVIGVAVAARRLGALAWAGVAVATAVVILHLGKGWALRRATDLLGSYGLPPAPLAAVMQALTTGLESASLWVGGVGVGTAALALLLWFLRSRRTS